MQIAISELHNLVIDIPEDVREWAVQDYENHHEQIEADAKSDDIMTRRYAKLVKILAGVN